MNISAKGVIGGCEECALKTCERKYAMQELNFKLIKSINDSIENYGSAAFKKVSLELNCPDYVVFVLDDDG